MKLIDLQSEGPVGTSERPDDVGTGSGKEIVDGVSGRDDTFTALCSYTASLPRNDISSLFRVKCLKFKISASD